MIIVAALQQEVEGLPWPIQLTGVGKINATRVMVCLLYTSDAADE